jgi:hypothetical protein
LIGIIIYIRGYDGRIWSIGGMIISQGKLKYLKNTVPLILGLPQIP